STAGEHDDRERSDPLGVGLGLRRPAQLDAALLSVRMIAERHAVATDDLAAVGLGRVEQTWAAGDVDQDRADEPAVARAGAADRQAHALTDAKAMHAVEHERFGALPESAL